MKITYLALVVIVLASVIMAGCITAPVGQSILLIAVKDAPKTTDIGTITYLGLHISEVSVHQASANQTAPETDEEMTATESDDSGTAGWTVVVDKPQTVDLMLLTDMSEVIGQKTMEAGKYTQIRLKIDSGTVTVDGTEHNLAVPSGVLKLNRGFVLIPNETLKLTLDFNVEKSVIRIGSDQYKLKPVIAVISETISGMSEQEQGCVRSGGMVTSMLCCNSVRDFPNLCLAGACGCAAGDSHQIRVCNCGTDKCFNGTVCVAP
ncbi:MAG TPA: DUF4382 domain-containing protein [Methanoregula sp.]|nr:DUF4382 domain-containing protein [Methanoregula sp.]